VEYAFMLGMAAHGVLVTAVSTVAFGQALAMTRRGGTVSLVGLPPGDFPIPIFVQLPSGRAATGAL
jgi:propanol-preferring alcohol dehydrogenase